MRVRFNHWIEPDPTPISGNVSASGDRAEDAEVEREVLRQLRAGNEAAWCIAQVTASIQFDGEEVSYGSERELWSNLLTDMKANALDDLFERIREIGTPEALVTLDQMLLDPANERILRGGR